MTSPNDSLDSPFERLRRLFEEARQLPQPAQESFVRKAACGDQELAAEVLAMLRNAGHAATADHHHAANELLAGTANGQQIGPYRILDTLGEGGMGRVYLAEQRYPVRRRVAIKVLKPGFDSKAFLTRFDAERQALSMMEHSAIAKVYDAGTTDDGRPYLVMEFVKGVRITDYCDQNQLDLEARIELFRSVCSGIQHAHTKGVMHRDLKPSNVLVTVQDGLPSAKIIDFGLAKAVSHQLVDATLFTEQGQILGTPEYMSPEQAGIGGLDVDTRTDIYSLGVLLYELLTGTLPTSRAELLKQGWLEMQRVIREGTTRKPSTQITTLGPEAEEHAKVRQLHAADLERRLRGELDWIVMKALEKDRTRRYETAHEFAADLERYLQHQPVQAGPPSTWYLLKKLAQRHKGQALTGAAVLGALVIGLGWALAERSAAKQQEQRASLQEAEALRQAKLAEDALTRYRQLEDGVKIRQFEQRCRDATLWPEGSEQAKAQAAWLADVDTWLARPRDPEGLLGSLRSLGRKVVGGWQFDATEDQFLHDAMVELVSNLQEFQGERGPLQLVRKSLEWSRTLHQRTIVDESAAWQAVATRVLGNPRYQGLRLEPQLGLVPIGPDPASGLEEFWLPRTGERPKRGPDKQFVVTETTGVVLVLLPGGSATIGSPAKDPTGNDNLRNELPQTTVTLSPFFLGKFEVAQSQWQAITFGMQPSRWPRAFDPVENVSYATVVEWLERIGLQLPTEPQWEYACRAGTKGEWWFGDRTAAGDRMCLLDFDGHGRCNAADGYVSRRAQQNYHPEAVLWPDYDDGRVHHGPIWQFEPNPFGLHQVHGNVAELTRGSIANYDDSQTTFAPGDGEILGGRTDQIVVRGGSFFRSVDSARSAIRTYWSKDTANDSVGFRVARQLTRSH